MLTATTYRITVEEVLLANFGDEYQDYMRSTWRMLPGWQGRPGSRRSRASSPVTAPLGPRAGPRDDRPLAETDGPGGDTSLTCRRDLGRAATQLHWTGPPAGYI